MRYQQWMIEREADWSRLEELLRLSEGTIYQLSADEMRETGLLYRGLMNDLSRARTSPDHQHLVPYLNNLALRCHGRVYESPPTRLQNVLVFFLKDFPRCFRRNFPLIFLAFATFVLGTVIAMATVKLDPTTASQFLPPNVIEQLKAGKLWTDDMKAVPSQSSFIMTNNIKVAIQAYAGGIFFGVGTLLILFSNGMFAFGGPLQVCFRYGLGRHLLLFCMAHSVIELTTVFIAGGAGMMVGFALLFPGDLPRWEAVRIKAKESLVLVMGCFPLLVIAGCIEGMVSLNQSVGAPIRVLIALCSGAFLAVYLGFSGLEKKESPQKESPQKETTTV